MATFLAPNDAVQYKMTFHYGQPRPLPVSIARYAPARDVVNTVTITSEYLSTIVVSFSMYDIDP